MVLQTTTEFFHKAHDPFGRNFQDGSLSFHNLLWQLIVNEARADKIEVFYAVHRNGNLELVLVEFNKSGYYPTHIRFAENIAYDLALDICEHMNTLTFGVSIDFANKIVGISMRKEPVEDDDEKEYSSREPEEKVWSAMQGGTDGG